MNDDTVGSKSHPGSESHLMPFQRLDVYVRAKALVVAVHRAGIRDDELRDQARRASKSVFLHVSEGLPNYSLPMRRRYFVGARNSACETSGAADAAMAIGCLDERTAIEIMQLAQDVSRMLARLMR